MNEIVNGDGRTELRIVGEEIPFGAYQAIYHKLTRKVERDRRFYDGAYEIEIGDIENLHQRLSQSIKQYQVKANRCEITHVIKDESTRFHSSLEKFKLIGQTNSACTQRLAFEFDFLIILPPEIEEAKEIAQRYKLSLVLDQDLSEDRVTPYLFAREPDTRNIDLNIEYSDYAVFQHLRAVVDEWVSGLPKREPSAFFEKLYRREKYLRTIVEVFVFSAALFAGIFFLGSQPDLDAISIGRITLFCLALAFCGTSVSLYLYSLLSSLAAKMQPITYLHFTTGDEKRKSDWEASRKKRIAAMSLVAVGVVLPLIVNLTASAIFRTFFELP